MKYEALKIGKMASGNLTLELTENVSWEDFPVKAKEFLRTVGGRTLFKVTAPDTRTWLVLIGFRLFFLSFDDFPYGMSLDSLMKASNAVIENIYHQLKDGSL